MNNSLNRVIELPSFGVNKFKVRMVADDGCHLGLIILGICFSLIMIFGSIYDMKEVYPNFQIYQKPEYIEAEVSGGCKQSESRRRNPVPPVECGFYIKYEGKIHQRDFNYVGSLPDTSGVRAVRSQNDHNLISVDLALQHITAIFLRKLMWLLLGVISSIGALYLIINRLKARYFTFELNRGITNLVLIPIDHLRELGKGDGIRYFNCMGKVQVRMRYGDLVGSKKSHPYLVYRHSRLYVLIARNDNTGNFLVVDEGVKRLRLGEEELQALREELKGDSL